MKEAQVLMGVLESSPLSASIKPTVQRLLSGHFGTSRTGGQTGIGDRRGRGPQNLRIFHVVDWIVNRGLGLTIESSAAVLFQLFKWGTKLP